MSVYPEPASPATSIESCDTAISAHRYPLFTRQLRFLLDGRVITYFIFGTLRLNLMYFKNVSLFLSFLFLMSGNVTL